MESALKTVCGMELAEKDVSELKTESTIAVDFVDSDAKARKVSDKEAKSRGPAKNPKNGKINSFNGTYKPKISFSRNSKTNVFCYRCGQNHLAPNCTFPRSIKCRECDGLGHLQKVCKKKRQTQLLEEVCRLDDD